MEDPHYNQSQISYITTRLLRLIRIGIVSIVLCLVIVYDIPYYTYSALKEISQVESLNYILKRGPSEYFYNKSKTPHIVDFLKAKNSEPVRARN